MLLGGFAIRKRWAEYLEKLLGVEQYGECRNAVLGSERIIIVICVMRVK